MVKLSYNSHLNTVLVQRYVIEVIYVHTDSQLSIEIIIRSASCNIVLVASSLQNNARLITK